MLMAALWFNATRMPFTKHKLVAVPEIFVTKAASPKPISRTLWQNPSSPVSRKTRAVLPAGSWHNGDRGSGMDDIGVRLGISRENSSSQSGYCEREFEKKPRTGA
jgi:hypothetical protein